MREYFGMASFGKIFGIMMRITAVGKSIGPSIAGWTYDTLGSYHPIWIAFAGIAIIPVIVMLTLKPYDLEYAADLAQMDSRASRKGGEMRHWRSFFISE